MEILSDPTPDMLAMPRFDDGAIDMQELLRRPTTVPFTRVRRVPTGRAVIFRSP